MLKLKGRKNENGLENKNVYVFIDAGNLWDIYKAKKKLLDFKKLKKYLEKKFQANKLKIYYYTSYPKPDSRRDDTGGQHAFYTFLEKNLGFKVVKKPLKQIKTINNNKEIIKEKGNMDVEITIDVVDSINCFDIAILFSGDSDFLELANYIKKRNKKIYIYSSKNSVSTELKYGGDGYKDLLEIKEIWGNELVYKKKTALN
ncbi:NYN domain-containing protein [Patescibacteria group bacterium]